MLFNFIVLFVYKYFETKFKLQLSINLLLYFIVLHFRINFYLFLQGYGMEWHLELQILPPFLHLNLLIYWSYKAAYKCTDNIPVLLN
jgi:hypothetical protein